MKQIVQIPIFILGPGKVGQELLKQILITRDLLLQRKGVELHVLGVSDSRSLLYNPEGLSVPALDAVLMAKMHNHRLSGEAAPSDFFGQLQPGTIVVDTSASADTAPLLWNALSNDCGVVLANKKPLSRSWAQSKHFFSHPFVRWEATVGAGLPVIRTLNYLLNTGDRVHSIEGCLSGTLGYLCSQMENGASYSQAVSQAKALGYTEPNPRDDLSGMDVVRKILILARTAGFPLELSDLQVEALFPASLASLPDEAFLEQIHREDASYEARFQSARQQAKALRYLARVDSQGGSAQLASVPEKSIPAALRGPESYISFTTDRYSDTPMVVTGPGAGPAVTAAAVMEDVIELGQMIQHQPAINVQKRHGVPAMVARYADRYLGRIDARRQ